jgi:arginine decarboxylase
MEPIRVVWGTGEGPTEMASYDAALAAAGVGDYNLVSVSSVIPPDATVEAVGAAPDLGTVGGRVTVVQAGATARERVSAALAWAESPAGGLFYEAAAAADADAVRETAASGLAAGRDLRDWSFDDPSVRTVSAEPSGAAYASAVVLAVYGSADPLL